MLKDLGGLPRTAALARFGGGSVTAGEFRFYLDRMGVDPAQAQGSGLRERLRAFSEDAVVTAFKKKGLEAKEGYVESIGKHREKLIVQLYFDTLYAGATVSPEEVERAYRENPAVNKLPERVELFQIRLATSAEADEVYRRLQEGYDPLRYLRLLRAKEAGRPGVDPGGAGGGDPEEAGAGQKTEDF
jgi:parvulin-like peptidyl-prolyl isomerase